MSHEALALETQLLLQEVTHATANANANANARHSASASSAPSALVIARSGPHVAVDEDLHADDAQTTAHDMDADVETAETISEDVIGYAPPVSEYEAAKQSLLDKLRRKKETNRQQLQRLNQQRYGYSGRARQAPTDVHASAELQSPHPAALGASTRRLTPVKHKRARLPVTATAPTAQRRNKDLLSRLRQQAIQQGAQEMAKLFGYSSYEAQLKHLNRIEKEKIRESELLDRARAAGVAMSDEVALEAAEMAKEAMAEEEKLEEEEEEEVHVHEEEVAAMDVAEEEEEEENDGDEDIVMVEQVAEKQKVEEQEKEEKEPSAGSPAIVGARGVQQSDVLAMAGLVHDTEVASPPSKLRQRIRRRRHATATLSSDEENDEDDGNEADSEQDADDANDANENDDDDDDVVEIEVPTKELATVASMPPTAFTTNSIDSEEASTTTDAAAAAAATPATATATATVPTKDRAAAFRRLLQEEASQTRQRKRLRRGGGGGGAFVESEAEEDDEEDVLQIGGLGDFGFGVPQALSKESKDAADERNALRLRADDLEGIVDDLSDSEQVEQQDLDEIVRREQEAQDRQQVQEVMRNVKEGFGRNRRAFSSGHEGARGRFNLNELVAADGNRREAARLGLLESDEGEEMDEDEDEEDRNDPDYVDKKRGKKTRTGEDGEEGDAQAEEEDEEAEMERMLRERFLKQPKIYITSSESEGEEEDAAKTASAAAAGDGALARDELESDEERERQQMKLFSERARINRRMQRMKDMQRLEQDHEGDQAAVATKATGLPNLLLEEDEESQMLLKVLNRTDVARSAEDRAASMATASTANTSAATAAQRPRGRRMPATRFNSFRMTSSSSFSRAAQNCKLFTAGSGTSSSAPKSFVFASFSSDKTETVGDENATPVGADAATTRPVAGAAGKSARRPFASLGKAAASSQPARKKRKSDFLSVLASTASAPL